MIQKITNMQSQSGKPAANQFVIENATFTNDNGLLHRGTAFQSYHSIIVFQSASQTFLDETYWNYSKTTARYRAQFLGETTAETQAKIDSGEYILTDLN